MKKYGGFILLGIAAVSFAIVNNCSSSPKMASKPEDVRANAKDAYIYGYPLVLMDVTKTVMTGVSKPKGTGAKVKAPVNQFANMRSFPDDAFTDVVTPNADTLYSTAWLDLTQEPQVVTLPPTGDRYFLAPMLDAWTNVFFSPGTRTTGNLMQNYAVVGPGWKGNIPAGLEIIQAPTNTVWIIGRTAVKGSSDFKGVHYIQDRLMVTPMSQWGKPYRPATAAVDKTANLKTPPSQQVMILSAEAFFTKLAELMKTNPPLSGDRPALRNLARIGIIPGESFDASKFSPEARTALSEGALEGYAAIVAGTKNLEEDVVDNWTYTRKLGDYGKNYLQRAVVAMNGLGANLDADALYMRATKDTAGEPLSGKNQYLIHFEKNKLPPVNGFWSLTMYNSKQSFVKNPQKRYAIGDRSKLAYNNDGSLDLYIQNRSPGKNREGNWLPAPRGEFNLVMRLYGPKPEALDGRWRVPGIQRTEASPQLMKAAWVEKE